MNYAGITKTSLREGRARQSARTRSHSWSRVRQTEDVEAICATVYIYLVREQIEQRSSALQLLGLKPEELPEAYLAKEDFGEGEIWCYGQAGRSPAR